MSFKINLGSFLTSLSFTKLADQVLGVTRGDQFVTDTGITPTHVTGDEAKVLEQQVVDAAVALAKPVIEHTVNTSVNAVLVAVVTKFVPADLQAQAIAEGEAAAQQAIDAPIEAWTIEV